MAGKTAHNYFRNAFIAVRDSEDTEQSDVEADSN